MLTPHPSEDVSHRFSSVEAREGMVVRLEAQTKPEAPCPWERDPEGGWIAEGDGW